MRGSHLLPDQLPGEHTGLQATRAQILFYNCLQCCHSHTHSHMVTADRVRWLGMFQWSTHVLLYAPDHIDMIVHIPAFNELGSTLGSSYMSYDISHSGTQQVAITSLAASTVSWMVSHPSINQACVCLTSVIRPGWSHLVNETPYRCQRTAKLRSFSFNTNMTKCLL